MAAKLDKRLAARRRPSAIDGRDLSGLRLDGMDLSDQTVRRVTFDRAQLRRANFENASFFDCSFRDAVIDAGTMARTIFENCDFTGASMTGVDAKDSVFRTVAVLDYTDRKTSAIREAKTSLEATTIASSDFSGARLVNATLTNVVATDVKFDRANLAGAVFDECTLAGSSFTGATLSKADFSRAVDARSALPEWALSVVTMLRAIGTDELRDRLQQHRRWLASNGDVGTRLDLRATDLAAAQLDRAEMSGGDVRDSRLDRASLVDARLVATDLRGATLVGADLLRADLRGALADADALARAVLNETLL